MNHTVEQINKLPKWAQDYIRDLERQREAAVRCLNEFVDNDIPSPISISELISTGENTGPSFKKRYVQADSVDFHFAGVHLSVTCRQDHIRLQWSAGTQYSCIEAAFIPESFQHARIVAKENMR